MIFIAIITEPIRKKMKPIDVTEFGEIIGGMKD